jgi:hypothetical protein
METRYTSGYPSYALPEVKSNWPLWQFKPGVVSGVVYGQTTYLKKKFAFGDIVREIYVHGDLTRAESEMMLFQLIVKLFDVFVEA